MVQVSATLAPVPVRDKLTPKDRAVLDDWQAWRALVTPHVPADMSAQEIDARTDGLWSLDGFQTGRAGRYRRNTAASLAELAQSSIYKLAGHSPVAADRKAAGDDGTLAPERRVITKRHEFRRRLSWPQ
jgi:hypothetical protein